MSAYIRELSQVFLRLDQLRDALCTRVTLAGLPGRWHWISERSAPVPSTWSELERLTSFKVVGGKVVRDLGSLQSMVLFRAMLFTGLDVSRS